MIRYFICVALVSATFVTANVAAQRDQPPYLYYFSPDLNAFVVERADGSQRRLFGQGLAATGTDEAGGAWSPSGKYFAWTTSTWAGPGDVDPQAWIVSADGKERLTMLDNLRDVDQFAWSPVEDLLFVVDTHVDGAAGATYYLINVETRDLITSFSLFNWQADFYHSLFRWTPDGSHVVLFYDISNRVNGEWTTRRFRRAVSRVGEIDDAPIGDTFGSIDRTIPTFSASGDIAYLSVDEEQLVVENIAAKNTQTYDMPDARHFYAIYWSNSGHYALLSSTASCDSSTPCADLWGLSDTGLVQIAEQVRYNEYYPPTFWAPSGDLAQFVTLDGTLHIFNPETQETTAVLDIQNVQEAFWSADGQLLYVAPSGRDVPAYLYDTQTGKNTLLDATRTYGDVFQIISSPNSHYFALGREFAILDLRERKIIPLRAHEKAISAYYSWHPGSGWLIYNQMLYAPGGGYGPVLSAVTRSDGSLQRDLSQGYGFAQWVPDNAVPYLSEEGD